MAYLQEDILIKAPIDTCFDLARDIGIHSATVWPHTKEKAIHGITSGLIGYGETVTFEAAHFGIRQTLYVKIVEFDRPYRFTGEMLQGAFRHMRHTHLFREIDEGTLMSDIMEFASPYGIIGQWFDALVLERYMKSFIIYRQKQLKLVAESHRGSHKNRS